MNVLFTILCNVCLDDIAIAEAINEVEHELRNERKNRTDSKQLVNYALVVSSVLIISGISVAFSVVTV